jgi:hypothetical protein
MSAQYRDNLNKSRSLYSNATTRQNCVSCPSSCSCNLGGRSTMDQLMFRAWSKGPDGDPSVFHHSSKACPSCGRVGGRRRESYEDLQAHRTHASSAGGMVPVSPCTGSVSKCTMPTEAESVPGICEGMVSKKSGAWVPTPSADACNELVITSPGGWAHKCYWSKKSGGAAAVCTTGAICKPSGQQVKAACPGTWTGLPQCKVQDGWVRCAYPSDGDTSPWLCLSDRGDGPVGLVITSPDGWGYMCENTRTTANNLQCHPKTEQVNAACGVPTTYKCDDSGSCKAVTGPGGTSLAVCEQTPFVPGSCSCPPDGTPSNMYEDDCKNAGCTWSAGKKKQHCGAFGPY